MLLSMKKVSEEKRSPSPPTLVSRHAFFTVIGNGEVSHCTNRTLLLATEKSRYLFNCSEASQKAISEVGPSGGLAQMNAIFLTGIFLLVST